jgi:hypothetical protein
MGFDINGPEVEQVHYIATKRACLCFMAPLLFGVAASLT